MVLNHKQKKSHLNYLINLITGIVTTSNKVRVYFESKFVATVEFDLKIGEGWRKAIVIARYNMSE